MRHYLIYWFTLIAVVVSFQSVHAKAERVALVIGNADYLEGRLKNPVNDADLMTKTLTAKGFVVTTVVNGTSF